MTGGNVWMFAPEMTNRRGGIQFSFGSNAELFGRTCIGNLALDGEANLAENGQHAASPRRAGICPPFIHAGDH